MVTEPGTSVSGIKQAYYANRIYAISPVFWSSIGYMTGCHWVGAFAADVVDRKKSVVLFIGDTSPELTAQKIFTINSKSHWFMLNIDGYTIERPIHGKKGHYNNIQPWRGMKLVPKIVAADYETHMESHSGRLRKGRDWRWVQQELTIIFGWSHVMTWLLQPTLSNSEPNEGSKK